MNGRAQLEMLNTLDAWRIEQVDGTSEVAPTPEASSKPVAEGAGDGDLPF